MRFHPASPEFRECPFGQIRYRGLFSSPKPPVVPTPVVMPTMQSSTIAAAQQQQMNAAAAQSGRASTILSRNDNSKFGSADTMGG